MSKKKCVVLYSGGMDSTVVLHHALQNYDQIYALTFDYGQRHQVELNFTKKYLQNLNNTKIIHTILDIKSIGSLLNTSALLNTNIEVPKAREVLGDPQSVTYVPNRNMMFLSIAASIAEAQSCDVVFYGAALADDTSGYWDCTLEFRKLINQILFLNRRNSIQIQTPLIEMNKKQIVERGLELGVFFENTHTCYNPVEDKSCGECTSCAARIAGFIQAGYIDPINYYKQIPWQDYNCVRLY